MKKDKKKENHLEIEKKRKQNKEDKEDKEDEDEEFKQIGKNYSKYFTNFWYNRIYSFRNVCIKCEEDKFKRLEEINERIEQNGGFDQIEYYSSDEEYDYEEYETLNQDIYSSDSE